MYPSHGSSSATFHPRGTASTALGRRASHWKAQQETQVRGRQQGALSASSTNQRPIKKLQHILGVICLRVILLEQQPTGQNHSPQTFPSVELRSGRFLVKLGIS